MEYLLAHCQIIIDSHGGEFLALWLAGLTGSLTHCVGMCGPFVITQVTARLNDVPAADMRELTRLKGASLVPYHLGRMTSYAVLGGVSASLTRFFVTDRWFVYLAISMLVVAICLFLASIWPKMMRYFPTKKRIALPGVQKVIQGNKGIKRLMSHPFGLKGYTLGICLGFLPCGLVYGALMVVASTGNVIVGVAGMIVFASGTIPGLLLVGLGASFAPKIRTSIVRHLVPAMMILSSLILLMTVKELL